MLKLAVGFGAVCGITAILACLWAGIVITSDINEMYDDVMSELGDFRDVSDDSWENMMVMRRGSESADEYIRGIFGRNKRSSGQCSE